MNVIQTPEAAVVRLTSETDDLAFDCAAGESILEAALRAGLPMAHACSGRARCSTCRIWIMCEGAGAPPANEAETALKEKLALGPNIRLACQLRPTGPIAFRRLILDESDLAVANQLDRGKPAQAGELRNVAVMFFDVQNFTGISEKLPPYDVMFLLNKFLTRAGAILERYGGFFDKAIGDGFLAIFGARGRELGALRAVAAALEILAAVDRARPVVRKLYGVRFDARIGLHYGEALIGALGPAGDERLTVIGDVANIASRVEQANKTAGTRLLITEELYAETRDHVVSPDFVRIPIPGVEGRRTLYEVTRLNAAGERLMTEMGRRPISDLPGRTWRRVLDAAELAEGDVKIAPQTRLDLALTRRDGRVYAFNNHCPHNRLPFFGLEVGPETGLPPTPPCSTFPAPGRVACRFHGSEFDLATGGIVTWCPRLAPDGTSPGIEVLGDLSKNEARLEVYQCREIDGAIWVEF